ncbi:FtsX-like permease family protein [Lewinella sp. LCG006]|uniref:permease prefix domain 2-containing transporter n=1 Tax=Lewinella sp. LCG006 TaxID=3231911 RepID=UPI00346108F3
MSNVYAPPPAWARRFLTWFCDEHLLEEIAGDLEEAYYHRCTKLGESRARQLYVADVFTFFKPYAFEKYSRAKQFLPMLDNYFKIALRNIFHRKGFTAINAVGLIVGMSAIILIGRYLHHEYTYDEAAAQADLTYRLVNKYRDQIYTCMSFPRFNESEGEEQLALLNHLKTYDQVAQACHFVPTNSDIGGGGQYFVRFDEEQLVTNNILFTNTGAAFQELFPQTFLLGTPGAAYSNFSTAVLTESLARRWFGEDWAVRRLLGKNLQIGEDNFVLAGVIADVPDNSHYTFEMLLHQQRIPSWAAYTYVQLKQPGQLAAVMTQLNQDVDLVYPGYSEDELSKGVEAVALKDIHFTEDMLYEIKPVANANYLSAFGWVGLIVLLIIWTNYTNLSVAMYADRQREIGMRKVLGAQANDISLQLLLEAVCLAFICLPLILMVVTFVVPYFDALMGVQIGIQSLFSITSLLTIAGLLLLTGLISGSYPALVYGRRSTMKLFGKDWQKVFGNRHFNFRNALITLQFFLVIGLLSMTFFIFQQMKFVETTDLGFESEGIIYFNIDGQEKLQQLQTVLEAMPEIVSTGAGGVPGSEMFNQSTYKLKDTEVVLADGTEQYISWGSLKTLGIDCASCAALETGKDRVFVINQTAAEKLATIRNTTPEQLLGDILITEPEWENEQYGFGIPRTIDGIIEDYNFFSLKYPHQSLLLSVYREAPYAYEMLVKANTKDWPTTLQKIEKAYTAIETERPFEVNFLEDRLAKLYETETRSGKLLAILGMVAIVLALMGLSGVVAYLAYRRQKEIGIRKVLGASVRSILFRFHKEFSALLLVATILALPISLYLATLWLDSFAFRIQPHPLVIFAAGLITLVLVLIVISIQTRRAATRPPMEVLRA